jgi:pyruvate,orthophosphate dikinase
MASKKWVYLFREVDQAEKYAGNEWEGVRGLLGGKGANLADMKHVMPILHLETSFLKDVGIKS